MLSLETRANGVLINLIHVANREITDKKGNYFYDVKYYNFGENSYMLNFDVVHNRKDGAEKLLLKIYEQIDKLRKKTK
ncbi:MAG: hypothetical protein M1416_02940 [Candidatus Pacearchaeota archaeon]|nr:hypothetical protein [Candidatus Pacearchaeota archaeon]